MRVAVRKALAQLGDRVIEAQDGRAAIEVWKNHRDQIGLLLTGVVMPGGMTGRQLARRFVEDKPDLKLTYMSG